MNVSALPWNDVDASIGSRIAARLARSIVDGTIGPGELLTEADAAALENASRTPAREAMLQLERWGLVRLLPKKGAIVTAPSPAERRDLLQLRTTLEIAALERASTAPVALQSLIETLGAALEAQRRALADTDSGAFADADFAFHAAIIGADGNGVVREVMRALGPRFARLTHLALAERPARAAVLLAEHDELARLAGSPSAEFAAQLRRHVDEGHDEGAGHAW
ncbi:GntR family transcriptional regulator [Microbacterium sp. NPDC089320]|uniref:GntR family transcriptional regulator n=1 Tax=Microbacterium sp. NPDC089320 TaxID=3155182 RepID=UPI0034355F79